MIKIQTKRRFLHFGKNEDFEGSSLIEKRSPTQIVRNSGGHITGTSSNYTIKELNNYVDLLFRENHKTANLLSMYNHIPEVRFPIDYIASRVINGIFTVKRWDDDSVVWSENSKNLKDKTVGEKMEKFLTNPNPLQSFREFTKQYIISKLLFGESFVYAAGLPISKNIFETVSNYWILPAQSIQIDHPKKMKLFWAKPENEIILNYYLNHSNTKIPFDKRLILHTKDYHSLDLSEKYLRGESRLNTYKYPAANLVAVYEARNVIYTKRGAIGAVVSNKRDADGIIAFTEKEKEAAREEFNRSYGVESGKDPIALVDVPVDFVKFGMSIAELQPFEETLASASTIAGAYNVDSMLIPRKDHSTFNNLREAEAKVYTSMVIPEALDYCEKLSTFLGLNDSGYYIDVNFDHVEVLAEARNKKETSKRVITERCKVEFYNGIITLNEWRAALGKEAVEHNPIYDKTILEMSDTEIESLKNKML